MNHERINKAMSERKIKVAITLDDNNGMLFNKRRQSRDKNLIADLCAKTECFIYISPYSALLFDDFTDSANKIKIADNPLLACTDGDVAFVEGLPLSPYIDDIDELVLYRWNRLYPSDVKLDINIADCGFKMTAKYDFIGNSHNKITKEVYKRL